MWVTLPALPRGRGTPLITFSARVASLDRPSDLAERLPKALIHRNVPGEPVHQFLRDFDRAWDRAAPYSVFGPRQRWLAAVTALSAAWPVLRSAPLGGPRRWRLGEVSLPWTALAPPAEVSLLAKSQTARRCRMLADCVIRAQLAFWR